MRISHFTDRKHQPSAEEIRLALGFRYPLWERVIRSVEADHLQPRERPLCLAFLQTRP